MAMGIYFTIYKFYYRVMEIGGKSHRTDAVKRKQMK